MTPAALQHLLITHAPDVPGITAAAPRDDDDNPYGLTVTLQAAARVWWTITGTSLAPRRTGPDRHRRHPGTRPPGQICHIDRYSTRSDPLKRERAASSRTRDVGHRRISSGVAVSYS
jgi:hypothetical protein